MSLKRKIVDIEKHDIIDITGDEIKIIKSKKHKEFDEKDVIIYARVSTHDQNLEAQIDICKVYCNENELNIIEIIEEKCSAYRFRQPQLHNILSNNKNIKILVYCVDRFSRNILFCEEYLQLIEKNNLTLLSTKEMIDLKSAIGKFEFKSKILQAELEANKISERVKLNIEYKKRNNIQILRPIYGYNIENNKRVKNESEYYVIDFILSLYEKNKSTSQINRMIKQLLSKLNKLDNEFVNMDFFDNDGDILHDDNILINVSPELISSILNNIRVYKKNKKWTKKMIDYIYNKMVDDSIDMNNLII